MFNTMIHPEVVQKMQEVVKVFNEYMEVHKSHTPQYDMVDDVKFAHSMTYIGIIRDITEAIGAMEGCLNITEEDFIKFITKDGKIDMKDVRRILTIKALTDILSE